MATGQNQEKRRKISPARRRKRFLGLIERLEERLPLTGPYVNAWAREAGPMITNRSEL